MPKTRESNFYSKQCIKFIYFLDAHFTLKGCWSCNLTKNADPGKHSYLRYGIGFNSCSLFSVSSFDWSKKKVFLK